MPRGGKPQPPGPSLYPECYRTGTSGQRRHWTEGTVTCARCREQARRKLIRYRLQSARYGPRKVSALGTHRRIRALNRWGYTREQVAARVGWTQSALTRLLEQDVIYQETALVVAHVYKELVSSGIPGPSLKTRRRAEAAGWPGPGDWDDIDNPAEVPVCEVEAAHAEALEMQKLLIKREQKRQIRANWTEEQWEAERARKRKLRNPNPEQDPAVDHDDADDDDEVAA